MTRLTTAYERISYLRGRAANPGNRALHSVALRGINLDVTATLYGVSRAHTYRPRRPLTPSLHHLSAPPSLPTMVPPGRRDVVRGCPAAPATSRPSLRRSYRDRRVVRKRGVKRLHALRAVTIGVVSIHFKVARRGGRRLNRKNTLQRHCTSHERYDTKPGLEIETKNYNFDFGFARRFSIFFRIPKIDHGKL